MIAPKKPLRSLDFERMAEELERIAKNIRERPGSDRHFAERIERLVRETREESALPAPSQAAGKDSGKHSLAA